MAYKTEVSDAAVNAAVNALLALANGGTLKIYAGSQPTNANTAISGQTLLSTHTLSATAFQNAVAGVAQANAIGSATAVATGTASFFRVFTSGGAAVYDGSVGTAGCNLNLNSTAVQSGATVSITSLQFSIAEENLAG